MWEITQHAIDIEKYIFLNNTTHECKHEHIEVPLN
jgi:hypothetical protein